MPVKRKTRKSKRKIRKTKRKSVKRNTKRKTKRKSVKRKTKRKTRKTKSYGGVGEKSVLTDDDMPKKKWYQTQRQFKKKFFEKTLNSSCNEDIDCQKVYLDNKNKLFCYKLPPRVRGNCIKKIADPKNKNHFIDGRKRKTKESRYTTYL